MSTINALVHHIDQLLTQHRALQQHYSQLESRINTLEHELLAQQQQASHALEQEQQKAQVQLEQTSNQALVDDLNHLIGLFDEITELHHD